MEPEYDIEEEAFFEFMDAREAALNAAVGHFMIRRPPVVLLRRIRDTTTEQTIRLAAQIALHARGVDWR